jgi:3-hydroxyisobutyrate dehydrogenase-like beta-hydroxyacid dehydrogenase
VPAYRTYGAIIAQGKDTVEGFKMSLGLKYMRLALAAADARIVPMPIASLIRDHFVEAVAGGNGDADRSELGRLVARGAGIEPLTQA